MAHPVRLDLMELLAVEGPLTATECAARLGQTPANCSFHLRQLAAHGFIEEADSGPGRRRPWRVIVRGHNWDTGPDVSPAQRAAGELLTQVLVDWELNRLHSWEQTRDRETKQWQDAAVLTQSGALLTAEELREIGVQINELFAQYADRVDPARRPPGARLVSGLAFFHPVVESSYAIGDAEVPADA
jgi:DNA-binding MarR family transcriptional regulator